MHRFMAVLVLLVVAGCDGDGQPSAEPTAELPELLSPIDHGPPDYVLGQPAPAFALPVLTSEEVSTDSVRLSDLLGQVVVLNFWNSGCAPCIAEHQTLNHVAEMYGSRIQYLGINHGDSPETFAVYEERHGTFSYPNLQDARDEAGSTYDRRGWPLHVVIDPDGDVAWWRPAGPIRAATLVEVIDDVLAGRKPTPLTPAAYPEEVGS